MRIRLLLMTSPIWEKESRNFSCQGNVQTGCEANGMRSEVMRKNRMPFIRLKSSIRHKQFRLPATVSASLLWLNDASRKVRFPRQSSVRWIQGYPIFICSACQTSRSKIARFSFVMNKKKHVEIRVSTDEQVFRREKRVAG